MVEPAPGFPAADRETLYRAIEARRDVRRGFLPQPLEEATLKRILGAAHCAPSVGLMQPWRFIIVRDAAMRGQIHASFVRANEAARQRYQGEQLERYDTLKLEGILEAPQNLCVVCDAASAQGHGLGRQSMPEMAVYSAVCAVQNLWLAARAEGAGVGWVSILEPDTLRNVLHIPEGVVIVAYLCIGYVDAFAHRPELENNGWEQRTPLERVIGYDGYDPAWKVGERL